MKMICDVPDEVIKCIKDGTWCGSSVAEKMIANGIPLSSSEKSNKCEDTISRREAISIASIATLSVNQVVTALEKLPSVTPKPKSEWQQDHEILRAYSDGASAVLDKIKAEIEQLNNLDYVEPVTVDDVLQIINKFIAEEGKA